MGLAPYKKFLRPAVLLAVAVALFLYSDMLLWLAFLLLALFYFGVDVYKIDRAEASSTDLIEEFSRHETGVLGHYTIDSDELYGLFLILRGKPVCVDIREDKFIEERKKFARYLSDNADTLEANLNDFIEANPEYSSRQITFVGLHAKKLDQGEVFWEPDGYTLLHGLEFVA